MERDDREVVASFLHLEEALAPGSTVSLGDEVAHHVRVRRLGVGARLALLDGQGHRAVGTLVRLAPTPAVEIESLAVSAPFPPVHLLLPIADKDRMLWLAEKAAELGASSWRPIMFRRSRSVKPRGEGPTFNGKVKARMGSALEQSGGVWLPVLFPESTAARTAAALPEGGTRLVLDRDGPPLARLTVQGPVSIAVGPEGGLEGGELEELEGAGFQRASVGHATLRFETAALAALSIVRSLLQDSPTHG